jgi:hypothetical protein
MRTVHLKVTIEHPDFNEPQTRQVIAVIEDEDVDKPGTELRDLLIVLVEKLFAPIAITVVSVLIEHWVR